LTYAAPQSGAAKPSLFREGAEFWSLHFATEPTEAPLFRLRLELTEREGRRSSLGLTVHKIATVSKSKTGERIGRLDKDDAVRLTRDATVLLGLAAAPRTSRSG
jgi:mRNA interferase MazF